MPERMCSTIRCPMSTEYVIDCTPDQTSRHKHAFAMIIAFRGALPKHRILSGPLAPMSLKNCTQLRKSHQTPSTCIAPKPQDIITCLLGVARPTDNAFFYDRPDFQGQVVFAADGLIVPVAHLDINSQRAAPHVINPIIHSSQIIMIACTSHTPCAGNSAKQDVSDMLPCRSSLAPP